MKDSRDELVRIDERGEAHPIGSLASSRMRRRAGAYRLLPAPRHVVLMRYTGEDGRRDAEDGAVVRLGGEIVRAGAMCEIFGLLAHAGWRGELVVFDSQHERSLYFDHGQVVGAKTTAPDERLGEILYRFGAIDRDQHALLARECSALSGSAERVGEIAVRLGLVSQDDVYRCLRHQVEEIFYATLQAEDGTYFFLDGFDPVHASAAQALSASSLLMSGVTRLDEIRYFREKIPSSDYVPQRVAGVSTAPGEDFSGTFEVINGRRSIAELGRETGLGEFATTRDVFALLRSGHVSLRPPSLEGGLSAIVSRVNHSLRMIYEVVDSGERLPQLERSLGEFTAGAGLYEVLFQGAGPDARGQLQVETVAANAARLSEGDPERLLRQLLYDYLNFALFSSGQLLDSGQRTQVAREVRPTLTQLQVV